MAGRLYHDLAWLWPFWEDVTAYEAEAATIAREIEAHCLSGGRRLLDMGCGGGKTDRWLKCYFDVCGIDLSDTMLAQARALNPECTYLQADMRNAALDRTFDAVFINDALCHMKSEAELRAAFDTAYRHLAPGGVMVCLAETTKESFVQNRTQVSVAAAADKPADLDVTFVENHYDPDPADDTYEWTTVFLIRRGGRLQVEQDVDIVGLFDLATWRRSLEQAGFRVHEVTHRFDGEDYPTFVNLKPD